MKKQRKRKRIILIKFKDLPIGSLFYIKGWNGQKAIKVSNVHACHSFSTLVKFKFSENDKIKPVFYKGTKDIIIKEV